MYIFILKIIQLVKEPFQTWQAWVNVHAMGCDGQWFILCFSSSTMNQFQPVPRLPFPVDGGSPIVPFLKAVASTNFVGTLLNHLTCCPSQQVLEAAMRFENPLNWILQTWQRRFSELGHACRLRNSAFCPDPKPLQWEKKQLTRWCLI